MPPFGAAQPGVVPAAATYTGVVHDATLRAFLLSLLNPLPSPLDMSMALPLPPTLPAPSPPVTIPLTNFAAAAMPLPSPSFPTWALESNLAASFVEGVTGKLYNPGNMFEVPLALVLIGGVGQLDATRPLRFKARFRFFCIQDGKSTTYPGVRGGVAHGEEHAGDHEFGGALVDGRIEFAVPLFGLSSG
ncbi:hypothetical protein H9P43_001666 [Blastocladiella emersonii ATCC 22665]|nr:hypothetical protein H9P43_001666 [Blastocladiella emersonii ATCC 22665]